VSCGDERVGAVTNGERSDPFTPVKGKKKKKKKRKNTP